MQTLQIDDAIEALGRTDDRSGASMLPRPAGSPAASDPRIDDVRGQLEWITVRTPKGKQIVLSPPATVLECSRHIHDDFVTLAKGARVNGVRVGLFHELCEGDVVEIDIARAPRPLPVGWESHVRNGSERRRIRYAFRKSYRPTLERRGRAYVQQRLIGAGVWPVQEAEELDRIVSDVLNGDELQRKLRPEPPATSVAAYYEEMGVYEANQFSRRLPYRMRLAHHEVERLLLLVFARAVRDVLRGQVAEEVRGNLQVRLCDECCREKLTPVTMEWTGSTFLCHRSDGCCVRRIKRSKRIHLEPSHAHHFFIEARDRSGLVADIGAVFETAEVGLHELLALVVASGEAKLRARVDPMSRARLAEVCRLLEQVDGVSEVSDPESPVRQSEERHFPTRRDTPRVTRVMPQAPYDVGIVIHTEDRLYGRTDELTDLYQYLDEALDPASPRGHSVFVNGPYKVGKSSLVSTALAQLKRLRDDALLWVRLDAVAGESWRQYSSRLALHLLYAARELGYHSAGVEDMKGMALPELTRSITREFRCPIALAIDEITSLSYESSKDQSEAREFALCLNELRNQSGIVVVLIGPRIERDGLDPALATVLRTSLDCPVEVLSREHCGEIVRARKSKYDIFASSSVLDLVFWETLGNPYWTQLLAQEVWKVVAKQRRRSGSIEFRYTSADLKNALGAVEGTQMYFEQQYASFVKGPTATDLTRATLRLFVALSPPNRSRLKGTGLSALERRLQSQVPTSTHEVRAVLSEMQAVGTISCVRLGDSATGWVMPPILARHLRYAGILKGAGK